MVMSQVEMLNFLQVLVEDPYDQEDEEILESCTVRSLRALMKVANQQPLEIIRPYHPIVEDLGLLVY